MKITAKVQRPYIDVNGYKDALKAQLGEIITRAAFEYVQAVSEAVPSWSGASRATLIQLASRAGTQVDIQIANTAPESRVSLGLQNSKGDIVLNEADKGKVSFYYSTTLPHLIWNEFNDANVTKDRTKWKPCPPIVLHNPGPYGFQKKGEEAVKHVFDQFQMPDLKKFIKSKPV